MPKNLRNRPGGKHITEVAQPSGARLRRPDEMLAARVYAQLAASGYEDIRPAHRAVFHSISPEGSRIMELAERVPMTKQSWEALVEYLRERGSMERHLIHRRRVPRTSVSPSGANDSSQLRYSSVTRSTATEQV